MRVIFFRDERDAETKETTERQQGRCVNHVVAKRDTRLRCCPCVSVVPVVSKIPVVSIPFSTAGANYSFYYPYRFSGGRKAKNC